MPVTKFILLIARIFLYSALLNTGIFFITVYINTALLNMALPFDTHIEPALNGTVMYAIYTGLQLSLFFTTFTLLIIRVSIVTGTILTLRDIVRYYKKYILTSFVVIAVLACSLCVYFSNFSHRLDIGKGLISGDIVTYAMPCFWLVLTMVFYRGYQLKINEQPDGSKDRSWLEGNIEK
jgi:hypothetical protein